MGKTRGVHETTTEIRNRMVGMYEAGLGLREIAAAVNCSQRTVKRWLNRFDKEGNVETRERCGRKRATTQDQDEAIIRLATQTPIKAAKAVLPALGLNCSVDTVRERLHKAGIHNWNLSRKHIKNISIAISDSSDIQQPVWRPTGTQLGKKKLTKEITKTKNSHSQPKNKVATSQKTKSKNSSNNDELDHKTLEQESEQQHFSFPSQIPGVQEQPQMNEIPLLSQPLPPPPLPPPQLPALPHPSITIDSNQYNHSLNPLPQPLYQQHPGLSIAQTWPLDLVQTTHHYPQNLQPLRHEQHHSHLYSNNNNEIHHSQITENQVQPAIHPLQNFPQQKITSHQIEPQVVSEIPQEKSNLSQDISVTKCSEICSNENSRNSSISDETNTDESNSSKEKRMERLKKKKGGKVKGTLETSVEIRNRMIGMSEAGLSTLSIALAINRSERTVKRWLDRWHREGNVQTKERKGRRRITTKEQDDAIVAMATQQPLTAAKHVAPALGLKCSVDTIRERLHKAGIYSWKLGQKQGEGNTVHAVHLWQPSGNRTNKIKTNVNKKRKSHNKKRSRPISNNTKNKKRSKETSPLKVVESGTNMTPEKNDVQFQNQSPSIMQTSHKLSSPTALAETLISPVCPINLLSNQNLQPLGSVMQPQRPDCRLAFSSVVPVMPTQSSNNVPTYSSCMMGVTSHTEHMEQSDPMNYEPYIWSF